MASTTPQDEPTVPVRIGAGSFATVYVLRGSPLAFKVVRNSESSETLQQEFEALGEVHSLCNSNSFFRIPKPLAFHDAKHEILLQTPSPAMARSRRSAMGRPAVVGPGFFRPLGRIYPNPVYVMDRVSALPNNVSEPISNQYIPNIMTTPSLCRLYFGKVYEDRHERPRLRQFVNTNNFPLDISRYNYLRGALEDMDLPTSDEVAAEMGDILGRIHWRAGFDARDVEFVMGGDGLTGITFYVIDFNQMRKWHKSLEDISLLVDAFFQNDPYYPRPRIDDTDYCAFKEGYRASYPQTEACLNIADMFLSSIEARQTSRDERQLLGVPGGMTKPGSVTNSTKNHQKVKKILKLRHKGLGIMAVKRNLQVVRITK